MTTLITGGCGLVGIHVAKAVGEVGERVICVDTRSRPAFADAILDRASDMVTFVRGDVLDIQHLIALVDKNNVEGIVHAAAVVHERMFRRDPAHSFAINVLGTVNVLEAARQRQLRRVIYTSSGTIYGPRNAQTPVSEDSANPQNLYGESKYIGERVLDRYRAVYGLDALAVRVSTAYGPGKPWHPDRYPLQQLLGEAMHGNRYRMDEGGTYSRDFTYISDTALGICLAYRAPKPKHTVYNVAAGKSHTLAAVASTLNELFPRAHIEVGSGRFENDFALSGSLRGPLDISRARDDLGFCPKFDLRQGLEAYAKFLQRYPVE